jgi:hypothetical protein
VESYQELGRGTLSLGPLQHLAPKAKFCWCNLCSDNGIRTEWEDLWKDPKPVDLWDQKFDQCFALLPSRVVGFALKFMYWAQFLIQGVSEINHDNNDDVWKNLYLLENKAKDTLRALVENHTRSTKERRMIKDLVPGKGAGLVILLHGKYHSIFLVNHNLWLILSGVPGVGKTMTAEALAKVSKKPLMKIGARELDYASPSRTSADLDRYFKLAKNFGAILLMYVSH